MHFKRVFLVIVDSLGIGAMSDADIYDDVGADTLGNIVKYVPNIHLPTLKKLGLFNLHKVKEISPEETPLASYMRLNERSVGKDTMTGHWEIMGLNITTPFKVFTDTGFPKALIEELENKTGRKIIGNKSASGTEILDELAHREIEHGELIVYTSADSVLQICGDENTMGLHTLYKHCEIARELTMRDEYKVGRVIARPYVKTANGEYKRTSNRHDYALKPFSKTVLDSLKESGYDVISVGKINDIFDGEGITQSKKSNSSINGMEQTIEIAKTDFNGLCFVNLVDFDALWGHRRDVKGYAKELESFDKKLAELLPLINEDDLLLISADHGNDPTFKGTDHTREQIPLLLYSKKTTFSHNLGTGHTFAVIGATIAENFGVSLPKNANSVLNKII